MNKKQKRVFIRILIGLLFFIAGFLFDKLIKVNYSEIISIVLYISALVVAGYDVVIKAFKNIIHGQVFDENFLMALATIGAVCIKEFRDGAAVMLFYQVGELFQSYAVNKSRKSITALMDIRPDYANVKRDNEVETVDPYEVEVGDIIVIKPGEKIPLDAVVIEGNSTLDTSSLTGESIPKEVNPGDELISGSININGLLYAKVTKEFDDSTVNKILELVENAADNKSKSEDFITKFARYYTPIVVICALLLAVVPPLVISGSNFSDWIYRALTFLVISCPCALVISIPLSFFGGIGACSKAGVLVKGSNYLEALSKSAVAVFDKTGTLTKGNFVVSSVKPVNCSEDDLLELAVYAEHFSNHPISNSLKSAYKKEIDESVISDYKEIPGNGIKAVVNGEYVLAGNYKLMNSEGISFDLCDDVGTIVYVAKNGIYMGCIVISDEIKPDSKSALIDLKKAGINKTVMLTGDSKQVADSVAGKLGIDEVYAELLPQNKVEQVQRLIDNKNESDKLIFVGDGVNDAPVLALSDIGIAMGGVGSDAAIEAADLVIMTDELSKLPKAIKISRKTLRIVKENIVFAIGVKVIVLILGAFGIAPMWLAVFADVGVAIIAILNAIRTLRIK